MRSVCRSQDSAFPSHSHEHAIVKRDRLQALLRPGFASGPLHSIFGSDYDTSIAHRHEYSVAERDTAKPLVGSGILRRPGNPVRRRDERPFIPDSYEDALSISDIVQRVGNA